MKNFGDEVLTWQGRTTTSSWGELAKAALDPGMEAFSYQIEMGAGVAGTITILPLKSDVSFTLTMDAIGRTKGVLYRLGEHTGTVICAVAALSKKLPFDMADSNGNVITTKVLSKPEFWAGAECSFESVSDLALDLGIILDHRLRAIAGSAAFF